MNGAIVVDKPKGLTSQKVVNEVKKILKVKKAGHTGTLDPFATGVLPICLNNATKVIPYLDERYKDYKGIMHLGISTDTLDSTGDIIKTCDIGKIKESDILDAFCKFKGNIAQLPPMYSALKKNGVRLFKLARLGKEVSRELRQITIKELDLEAFAPPLVKFFVRCSKGTYVRVLSSDIGEELGCGAHLSELRRVSSGFFKLSESFTLEQLRRSNYKLHEINEILGHLKSVEVKPEVSKNIKNGALLTKRVLNCVEFPYFKKREQIVIKCSNEVIAATESLISSVNLKKVNDNEEILKILRVVV